MSSVLEFSALASQAASAPTVPKKVVAAAVAGNALEFYDFVSYAYFAVYIGNAFFPATSPYLSLLLSVAVFGVGFLARPLGALVLGSYADRVGRRPAFLLSMALITVGTLMLALTPSYQSIGWPAPMLVVIARLTQGMALGGNVGPATAFLAEIAPTHRQGLYTCWQLASQGIATFVAGTLGLALITHCTPAQMQAWGWRVPFLLSLALVPTAVFLRGHMPETRPRKPPQTASISAVRSNRTVVILGILVMAGASIATYVSSYMTAYAVTALHLSPAVAMSATLVVGLSLFVGALIGGWLSDQYGPTKPVLVSRAVLAVFIVPVFSMLVAQPSLPLLLGAAAFIGSLTALSSAGALLALAQSLPATNRAGGLALSYALATSLFGGTTQPFITWMIHASNNPVAPAWYVAVTSVLMCFVMVLLTRKPSTG